MSEWVEAEQQFAARLGVSIVLECDVPSAARRVGLDVPSPFRPPYAHLSLTHAGGVVVGAAVAVADRFVVTGLGVDYEPRCRVVSERAAQLFLDEQERERIASLPEARRSEARLALWTIKEAAYKATADNRGHTVAGYHVAGDSEVPIGAGVTRLRDAQTFRHAVVPFLAGLLAVAIRREEDDRDSA